MKPQPYQPIHDIDAIIERRDYAALNKACDENYKHMAAINAAAKQAGQTLYRTFSIQVADGYAYYQVTKVGKSSMTVKALSGMGDDYQDHALGAGRSIPNRIIQQSNR